MARAKQTHTITTDETRNVLVDMTGSLNGAELLVGTPLIQTSSSVITTDVQINTVALTINGRQTAIGQAVLFKVSSSIAGEYQIEVVCSTDAGQVVEASMDLCVEATIS